MNEAAGSGRRLALCLLCGLPGAGKSTLARRLRSSEPGRSVLVVTYDDVITPEELGRVCWMSEGSTETGGEETSLWKQQRRQLLLHIERLVVAFLESSSLVRPDSGSLESWQRFIGCLEGQGLVSPAKPDVKTPKHAASLTEHKDLCLVLDDNFYYQSMRYEVFQLARKYSSGFCQVYLYCPVELCLVRNRSRTFPVPDQIICHMEERIEKPDPKKNAWEQNSLILDGSELNAINDSSVIDLLNQALDAPLTPVQDDREQKEHDRAICAANILHQADKGCRHLITETMQRIKGTISVQEMKMLAQKLQGEKSKLLEQLRQTTSLGMHDAIDPMLVFKDQVDGIVQPYLSNKREQFS
uniref:Phosphoseryl-tRNA kinase n=1 Tax=Leptobrachium leishanense TaxID=445787 RepID=A0A8C5WLG1_9ANUR